MKEEIPVIIEDPPAPPVEEAPEEEEDSKDWFNADDIEQKKEEPEKMWFMPVDTYTGGFSAVLVDKALEAREKKPEVKADVVVEDIFEDPKESSHSSKDFFAPDDISRKSERYDQMFYKEWEEVEEVKIHDTKFTS